MSIYRSDLLLEVILVAATEVDERPFYFCEDGEIRRRLRDVPRRVPFVYMPCSEVAMLSCLELGREIDDGLRRIC